MTKFVKWNSLNQFHEVIKNLGYHRLHKVLTDNDFKITYGLKVKLHGTCAAVRISPDGTVTAQKRSSDIGQGTDNAGFREWVEANEAYFASLAHSDATIIVYGEWAGPGVQRDVAVSQIPHKTFFPFALDFHFETTTNPDYVRYYDPDMIEMHMNHKKMPDDIIVIPWHDQITIDFVNKEQTEKSLLKLNKMTEEVGEHDPLIKELFNVDGAGEGFVCYPFLGESRGLCYVDEEAEHFSHFNFKSKGEAHRVNKTKQAVNFDPEKFANKNRFADAFCTEQRMQQGFKEAVDEQKDMKLTANFIKWVVQDVLKESTTEVAEMLAAGITWADLSKVVATRAAVWYKERVSAL